MQRLEDLIGKKIIVAIQNSKEAAYTVTLHGVEAGGIWIENKAYERLLGYGSTRPKKTQNALAVKPVFFVPFSQIVFLVSFSTELDEESLRGQ